MSGKTKRRIADLIITAAALMISLVVIMPIVYCIFGAFKARTEFSTYPPTFFPASFSYLGNFKEALTSVPLMRYMLNSFIVAAIGMTVRITLAVLAAYSFAFWDFKGKNFFFFFILATMMLPGDTLTITNYLTVSRLHLLNTYLGMCITSFVGASQMFMLRQNFRSIPKELRDAALLDGCGELRFITTVILPISRPVIFTLCVQSFVTLWNAYLWPLLVTNDTNMRTVQVGVSMLNTVEGTNYHIVLAAVTITLIPSFILFVLLRKNIMKGMTAGALVG